MEVVATETAVAMVVVRKAAAVQSPRMAQVATVVVDQMVVKQVATREARRGSVTLGAVEVTEGEM